MAAGKNSIFVGGVGRVKQTIEGVAQSAFKPGQLLARAAAGAIDVTAKASTTFGNEFLICDDQAQTVGGSTSTAVVSGDTIKAISVNSGDFVLLSFATGQNVTSKGLPVASNGDGDFKLGADDGTEQIFAVTEEVINVTAAGTLVLCRAL
jgi:hypothetical protein